MSKVIDDRDMLCYNGVMTILDRICKVLEHSELATCQSLLTMCDVCDGIGYPLWNIGHITQDWGVV